ncbi:MAG: hypothetical protein IID08_02295 [Candidatus Hydrogenedentes bacterium]|nr:hypothetical protein [Candidatus Hydrogenedentota bacterium]
MEEAEVKIKAVHKVLGEPVICEFDAKTQRIRTNLFLFCLISIVYVVGGLRIDADSSVLGFKFEGLDDALFRYSFLAAIVYLAIHFFWCAFDNFMEWRLRITGTRVAFITAGKWVSEGSDYPEDPRQSTLYNWWKDQVKSISGIHEAIDDIGNTFDIVNAEIEKVRDDGQTLNIKNVIQGQSEIRKELVSLKSTVENVGKTISADRIPASLERFDNWFKYFLNSQNMRWLLIEFLFPMILAAGAILLLLYNPKQIATSDIEDAGLLSPASPSASNDTKSSPDMK